MLVTTLDIIALSPKGTPHTWHPVIVKVHTDEGLCGVGEAGLAYGIGHRGVVGVLRDLAEAFLIGHDPCATEDFWNRCQAHTFWGYGPGPIMYAAISALDMALWDIKGKSLGKPIYELLGGPCCKNIRAYASQVQFGWTDGEEKFLHQPEDYYEETKLMMDQGFTCVKVNPIRYDENGSFLPEIKGKLSLSTLKRMTDRVKAVREAGGDQLDILVEFNSRSSTEAAIQIGQAIEDLNCLYMEEPVHTMSTCAMNSIAQKVNIPLAAGERLYTRWQFLPFFQNRIISLAQPDVGLTGGFTEAKKICDLAHLFDVQIQAHVCGSPISCAAALHLEAAAVNAVLHEHHVHLLKPGNRNIVQEDYQPVNGYFSLPQKPGLGIELNNEVIKYADIVSVQ